MSALNNTMADEWGTWEIDSAGIRVLIEPSQKWLDEHPAPEPTPDEPEPTPDEPEPTPDEPEPTPAPTVWDEIAAAYTEGVNSIDE